MQHLVRCRPTALLVFPSQQLRSFSISSRITVPLPAFNMTIEIKNPSETVAPQPIELHPVQNYTFL